MCGSIRECGFKIPCLVRSDGEVVDGHLRLKAARKLGITDIPIILCDEWTLAQVKAFRLLVNQSAMWADWDEELLKIELLDLQALDFDLSLTGFDTKELDDFLLSDTPAEDSAPPLPVTKRVCYGLELDPKYADVVVERWQGLTGKKASLEGDGRTIEAVALDQVRMAA